MKTFRNRPASHIIWSIAIAAVLIAKASPAGAASAPTNPCELSLENGRLSGHASSGSLADVMREIGRVTGASIVGLPSDDRTLSFTFDDVPVAEALRRVLRGRNYTVTLRGNTLARVTFLGRSAGAVDLAYSSDVSTPEPSRTIVESVDPGTDVTFQESLTAAPEREAALEAMQDSGELATGTLLETAQNDDDTAVRMRAIEMLRGQELRDPLIYQTMSALAEEESDPDVREAAEALRAEIENLNRIEK